MEEWCQDLPEECWESVFNRLDHHQHFEALSLVCKRFLSISNQLRSRLTISNPTIKLHRGVSSLLQRFRGIKRIDLVDFHGDLDRLVREIARSGLKIEVLNMSKQRRVPTRSLEELGAKMRSLRILICSRLCFLQDSDLIAIADSFPSLEELDISYPEQDFGSSAEQDSVFPGMVTDAGITVLSSKLSSLQKINISGNHLISDRSLVALSSNCKFLRKIAAFDCSFISQNGIGWLIRHSPNLISLAINGNKLSLPSTSMSPSFTVESSLVYAKALCTIEFSQMALSDDLLHSMFKANLPLQKLALSRCRGYTYVGISSLLSAYRSLNYLDIGGADFLTDQSITELFQYLQNLSFINLNSCSHLTNSTLFNLARDCPSLEEIRMERTSLGEEKFSTELRKNNQIRTLKLAWNKCLSDTTLKKVGIVCPNLRSLDLSHCWSITEKGIEAIGSSCIGIMELKVNGCKEMANLGTTMGFSKLESLRAAGSGMNDEGLSMVSQSCRRLLCLDLEGCLEVTAKGVKEMVGNCKGLRELNLKKCCKVSADILAWMIFSRPSLRMVVPPGGFVPTEKQRDLFLRHGCWVCNG
ncbi:PREDICTED: F-box/LRR-repeat protein 2 [Nelumbo nucifera]|uniref:F-box/LRR-repeat protein 2 n=1 Tax=Nelumbo nucifera TaxID=4432 RepID=A0A1U7ZAL2_NELNU|nr:PREDICTED: F-box/LRR-repeat protein 2 [Nelumbo nucifera]